MDKSFTKKLYEEHHIERRAPGFSILKEERGKFFSELIGTGKKVLDLGCRDGALTELFSKGNDVLGVDIDANALKRAGTRGIRTMEMDLYGDWRELNGQKFDVVIAGEVLEHLFRPQDIIEKVKLHLAPDGFFAGSVPNAFSLINRFRYLKGSKVHTPLADPTHINHFSRKELVRFLSEQFTSIKIIPLGRFAWLDRFFPGMFSFDFIFISMNKIFLYAKTQ